jgi:hypothetical protein
MSRRAAAEPVSRAAVLAYRLRAQDLESTRGRHGVGRPGVGRPGVLEAGVQDTPPGATAPLALAARGAAVPEPYDDPELALVHGVRGTLHLHLAADLPLFAAALRPDDAADLLASTHGRFFEDRAAEGLPAGEAFDTVAAALREVMADGEERSKGALSTAVTPLVPEPLAPWCPGCGARHVHDGLFRMASLQAGLRLRPAGKGAARFLPPLARPGRRPDPGAARHELVRRFLRRCGPAGPEALAAWLGLALPAARRWWSAERGELAEVDVEGLRLWCRQESLPELTRPSARPGRDVRLLPPYDPVVELADRRFLVPDPARRKQVWRTVANPGVLLAGGDVAGVWRQRRAGGRLTVTVTPFGPPPAVRTVTAAAASLLGDVEVVIG